MPAGKIKMREKAGGEKLLKVIVAKASDGQRYPLPLSECLVVCDGERGSGPKGADDVYIYCLALSGVSSLKRGSLVLIEDSGP